MRLIGKIPSKKNSRITNRKTGRSFPSKAYAEWHVAASMQLRDKVPDVPLSEVESITLTFFHPDRRKYDLTNKAESVMDLMVDLGIIHDDNYGVVPKLVLISGGLDKLAPGCLIEISEKIQDV